MLYRLVYRLVLSKTDPERIHDAAMSAIGAFGRSPLAPLASATVGHRGGDRLAGLIARPVPGRLGMAAGQDKNGTAILGTIALGFAFTEIGTVTPRPQPGNEGPRLWRIPGERAFRNRMGFNNDGADAVARRLARLRSSRRGRACVVGVNIGKNRWVAAEDAAADYATCAGKLARYADYLVVNVSSPNTPGLRDLQAVEALRPIVRATRRAADATARRHVPVLVKIAPDLADGDVDAVARLVAEEELDGVVATNTTVAHSHGEGGVSGRPVRERALAVVSRLRTALGPHYLVIGVGGVFTVADAEAMISAGADLLETLTGFVYEGPLMPGRINRALARKPA